MLRRQWLRNGRWLDGEGIAFYAGEMPRASASAQQASMRFEAARCRCWAAKAAVADFSAAGTPCVSADTTASATCKTASNVAVAFTGGAVV